ncbi:pyridoxal-phosphate dependent enzyme [Dichotomicrobium thermohalophilum]|uniref:Cysteine synthase n=1 Tax=Dichotomicrobium thermohalophilum TaxID=933063 RepID=A0A397PPI3_9HYPH|nr:pyridoxal-phosphate dependent enzyme [Dichotomicrobium thermohalophilum]RIA47661.1 cysteine synthase [Dichotomicrobium thermohalophilum]
MGPFNFPTQIDDARVYGRAVEWLKSRNVLLPTFSQLRNPHTIPADIEEQLATISPDDAHPLNLFRVHWYNDVSRSGRAEVPVHLELPKSLTGVNARIVVAIGALFPMITAHKVLAAYSCLVPRIVTGRFDPAHHRAVWPSTGNYCRGGIAISRILNCHGVAVLPQGMSRERFAWLEQWVTDPADIVRTPGTESNVKEIYDACAELERDETNEIINQFSEFGNYAGHYTVTGGALEHVFESLKAKDPNLELAAFVAASGSSGTLATGDYLKQQLGSRTAVVEPVECPTLLYNGYGEHNIQGIGDKHLPLIHNVMNTDFFVAVSDRATDGLNAVFNSDEGKRYLADSMNVPAETVAKLAWLGFSAIANVLAAIKLAKYLGLGPDDVVMTVATDGADLYESELAAYYARNFPEGVTARDAAAICGEHLAGQDTSHLLEASHTDRRRIFNLGYFTWVEQQNIDLADFDKRADQAFWRDLQALVPIWDELITAFNKETGLG